MHIINIKHDSRYTSVQKHVKKIDIYLKYIIELELEIWTIAIHV